MFVLVHQIKALNCDTKQKNIVNSVSPSFLETFLTIANRAAPNLYSTGFCLQSPFGIHD